MDKKKKQQKRKVEVSDGSSSDEGVNDPNPPKVAKKDSASNINVVKNSSGEDMMSIGKMRFVSVREFKGRKMVDIREYYEDKSGGGLKPGKKGVSLSQEQFKALENLLPEINKKMAE
uniref:PC4 domain-containing protein n=1 Tax=Steinernema glaseri TaxID=37863 RepID=A0A1I7YEL5_9BILA